jgi:hypothetical protein
LALNSYIYPILGSFSSQNRVKIYNTGGIVKSFF